jgi:hypothetical protein
MKRIKSEKPIRNPIVIAMIDRYGKQITSHGNRKIKRPKDRRNSWEKDQ